uniref:Uncharacterized protein n=1 Tax=Anguilla anguilla TaxID=7936 RepID=A0A0E9S190_ANGAN
MLITQSNLVFFVAFPYTFKIKYCLVLQLYSISSFNTIFFNGFFPIFSKFETANHIHRSILG